MIDVKLYCSGHKLVPTQSPSRPAILCQTASMLYKGYNCLKWRLMYSADRLNLKNSQYLCSSDKLSMNIMTPKLLFSHFCCWSRYFIFIFMRYLVAGSMSIGHTTYKMRFLVARRKCFISSCKQLESKFTSCRLIFRSALKMIDIWRLVVIG